MLFLLALSAAASSLPQFPISKPSQSQIAVTVTVPNGNPMDRYISSPLVGLSIEQDRFPDWSGTLDKPNEYTRTVLSSVLNAMGVPPPIRVGGNSEDRTRYSPVIQYTDNQYPCPTNTTPYPEASIVTVGTDFWRLAGNFPRGTQFTFGVNLKGRDPIEAVTQARHIVQSFGESGLENVTLGHLDLGNEPDNYGGDWDVSYYARQWNTLATAIRNDLGASTPPFQFLSLSNPSSSFSFQTAVNNGLLINGQKLHSSVVSEHHYQGSVCERSQFVLAELMQKTYVRGNLSGFDGEIAAAEALGFWFELGETNSISCHGAPGISNTAGAAVWAIDYIFQAALRGVHRLYFHHGIGYKYNFFSPVSDIADGTPFTAPHILPLYHAFLIQAEVTLYLDSLYISELDTNSQYVSAYGFWAPDTHRLMGIVVINSDAYFSTSVSPRNTYNISLSYLPRFAVPYCLRRLSIPSADATSGLTYAGQSFETSSGKPERKRVEEAVEGLRFEMNATEVVFLMF